MNEHPYLPEGESYQAFFERLADRLRSEHGFDAGSRARTDRNWHGFPTGFSHIRYAARFCTEPRMSFRVEVYLQHPDKDWNKRVFDSLREREREMRTTSVRRLSGSAKTAPRGVGSRRTGMISRTPPTSFASGPSGTWSDLGTRSSPGYREHWIRWLRRAATV